MAIDQVREHGLADQIAQLQTNLAQQLPAEVMHGFEGAIEAVVNGDITANVVNVGRKARIFRCRTSSATP